MKKLLLIITSLLFLISASPQKGIKNVKLGFLKGEKELNIIFDYSNTIFKAEDGIDEEIYIEKNTIKEGEQWKEKWVSFKDTIKSGCFHSNFLKDFNLYFLDKNSKLRGGNFSKSKYTLNIKILGICIGRVPFDSPLILSNISFLITETSEIIAQFNFTTDGNSYTNEAGRVESAYERLGKHLAEIIEKKRKQNNHAI
jgi:hypothetical protein